MATKAPTTKAKTGTRKTTRSRRPATNSKSAGKPKLVDHFAAFCAKYLTLEDGTPLELYDEQMLMLSDFFGGTKETLILIPKKNGKTTLLAAVGLFHLAITPNAACYIGAASRDQATILFRQAKGYVMRSPGLQELFTVQGGYRRILSKSDSGELQVMAADANTGDGVIPTLALVDELHRHKSSDLYGVFRDGLGPRNGQMVTISTAGDTHDSPLGELRAKAYKIPGLERRGAYRCARSEGFTMHEWALEPDEDRDDLDSVKGANPAPWQTLELLQERHDSPSMTPWQWARFACGVWGLGSVPAFDHDLWIDLGNDQGQPAAGRAIAIGFDGARRRDGTALVGCDIESGHLFVLGYWQAPANAGEDWEVPEEEVDQIVEHAMTTWSVARLYGDPPFWESALDRWAGQYGVDRVVRWWTNRLKATAVALRAFSNDMDPERMSHDGDETLSQHIRNAVRHDTRMQENDEPLWVIRKDSRDSPRKIDLAMAAMLAWKARGDAIAKGALHEPDYSAAQWG